MTGSLATFTGFFSRSLVLGTLLPVMLFVSLGAAFIGPLLPFGAITVRTLAAADTVDFLALSFLVLLVTGLLYNLNYSLIRLFEGYPWRGSAIGQRRTERYQREFDALHRRWKTLPRLRQQVSQTEQEKADLRTLSIDVGLKVNNQFPRKRDSVLPTRMGNVVRSFEDYASHQYEISGATLWPRLQAVLDKEYVGIIEEAKASFDFMLNACVLSVMSALVLYVATVVHPTRLASIELSAPVFIVMAAYMFTAYLAYFSAVGLAAGWGHTVKGAFDLYRHDLLTKLGFDWRPSSDAEERTLWDVVSHRILYGLTESKVLPPFRQACHVVSTPKDLGVRVTRTMRTSTPVTRQVFVRIEVNDKQKRDGKKVVVIDHLPGGYALVHDSVDAQGRQVTALGTDPFRFDLGAVAHGQSITLSYRILKP